jgi:hypothetical protein
VLGIYLVLAMLESGAFLRFADIFEAPNFNSHPEKRLGKFTA